MLEQLSERLQGVFDNLRGQSQLTPENMDEALREIRRALLEADVSLRVVKRFLSHIKDRAEGEAVVKGVNPAQQLVKIVHDEMVQLLGGSSAPLVLEGKPALVMMFGLQGSGKTTTTGKLALKLKKDNKKPLMVAADVYRPAAIQQLMTLGKQIDVPVHTIEGSTDVLAIATAGVEKAKAEGHDVVLIDTAGRLQVDTDMMAELLLLERMLAPKEKLLVVDGMTGQEAVTVAEAFNTQLEMTGMVITKMDGDARGGAALSIVDITGKPIKFVGAGEGMSALETFHPDRMATRILGMGDVVTLVEKAQQAIDMDEAKALEEKMRKQSFSLEDFLKVQKQLKMLGSMDQILGMLPIPGLNKAMREQLAFTGEKQLKRVESMINSMTPEERRHPDIIKESRRQRIAGGCGLPADEVNQFLKQFDQMRMMMQQMTKMTDGMKKGKLPGGLHMPGRKKRKNKKGGMPNMPFGMPGMPNLPGGGFMPPGGFPGMK